MMGKAKQLRTDYDVRPRGQKLSGQPWLGKEGCEGGGLRCQCSSDGRAAVT